MSYSFDDKGYFINLEMDDIEHLNRLMERTVLGESVIDDPFYLAWKKNKLPLTTHTPELLCWVVFMPFLSISLARAYHRLWIQSNNIIDDLQSLIDDF